MTFRISRRVPSLWLRRRARPFISPFFDPYSVRVESVHQRHLQRHPRARLQFQHAVRVGVLQLVRQRLHLLLRQIPNAQQRLHNELVVLSTRVLQSLEHLRCTSDFSPTSSSSVCVCALALCASATRAASLMAGRHTRKWYVKRSSRTLRTAANASSDCAASLKDSAALRSNR